MSDPNICDLCGDYLSFCLCDEPPYDPTYNGWSSYPTWRVNLEICDDECQGYQADGRTFASVAELADALALAAEYVVTDGDSDDHKTAQDYAMAFLNMVNWYEIAEHWADDLVRPEEDAG